MTHAGRPPPEFGEVSPAKALRLSLAKAGQEVLGQVVTGSGIEELKLSIPKIAENLPEGALVLEMTGPRGCKGLLALDKALVCAITESLTIGRVSGGAVPERAPSRTDALLCRKFLVLVMTLFAARLVGHPAADWATGFVPEDPVPDLRRLPVMMDDVAYRMLAMEVDFAMGARIGQICIIVPWAGAEEIPVPVEELPPPEESEAAWREKLEKSVMASKLDLHAVLCRKTLSLKEVQELEIGSFIRIPTDSIGHTVLEAADGTELFRGRLGELNGNKAILVEESLIDGMQAADGGDGDAGEEAASMGGLSMIDAMSNASPGDMTLPTFEDEPEPELPPLDLDALEAGEGFPEMGGDEFPAMDLGSLNMDDLDDLPETID